MKKLLVLVVVLAMMGGCAGFGKWSPGAQKIVDFIAKPTDAQKAEATKWIALISAFASTDAISKAISIMKVIANGGSFILSEVEAALTLLADLETKKATAKGLMKVAKTSEQQFPALWAAVKAAKK